MHGRRTHPRFAPSQPAFGVLRILSDVVLEQVAPTELVAVSPIPAAPGERLTVDVAGGGQHMSVQVEVLDSRPAIIEGMVRHRLRLFVHALDAAADGTPAAVVS